FFSYSLTKTKTPKLTRRLVALVKKRVAGRRWTILDAMNPEPGNSIRDKVERTLWDADACFIEVTTSSPNIMFEAGFARALGYPPLLLYTPAAHTDSSLKPYFRFIGLSKDRPLTADFGDIEYVPYPDTLADAKKWRAFEQRLKEALDMLQHTLSPESRLV